jgi:hypothetical protein
MRATLIVIRASRANVIEASRTPLSAAVIRQVIRHAPGTDRRRGRSCEPLCAYSKTIITLRVAAIVPNVWR